MKITIDVPDTTKAAMCTYVYEDESGIVMHTKGMDSKNLERFRYHDGTGSETSDQD